MAAPPPSVLRRLQPAFRAWLERYELDKNLGFASYFSPLEIESGEAAMQMLGELELDEEQLEVMHRDVVLLSEAVHGRIRQLHVSFGAKQSHEIYYQRKRESRDEAIQEQWRKVAKTEQRELRARHPPPPSRPMYSSRLRQAQALEGDASGRHKAEEAQRKKWLRQFTDALRSVSAPSVRLAERSKHAEDMLELQIGPKRAGTLRMRVRTWSKYREWLQLSYGLNHPTDPHHFLDYLLDRRAEPCTRGVLAGVVDTLKFVEKAMGLPLEGRITENEYVRQSVSGILQSTCNKLAEVSRGPAKAPLVWCLIGLERAVVDPHRVPFDRMLAWWILTSSWAVLRFDDHRGIVSGGVTTDGLGLNVVMMRTKTTGHDKAVQSKPGFVSWSAWIAEPNWLQVGWDLWCSQAPWERDYLLVVPTADGGCRPRELKYAEYTGRMRGIIANLDVPGHGTAGGSVASYWQPHSWRSFLPSVLEAVGAPSGSLGWLSAWRPRSGEAYVRTQKEKTRIMQATVARILRAHLGGDDPVGELGNLRGMEAHLVQRGMTAEEAASVCEGMRQFPGASVEEILWPRVREEVAEAAPTPEPGGIEEPGPEVAPEEDVVVPRWSDGYVISISNGRRVRRLHRLGLCYRQPGVHYFRYEEHGTTLPNPDQYNDYCKDCWKKSAPTDGVGAADHSDSGEDTSSSSSSSSSEPAAPSQK